MELIDYTSIKKNILQQKNRKIDFQAEFWGQMKTTFKEEYEELSNAYRRETGISFCSYIPIIPGHPRDQLAPHEKIAQKHLDDFPGVLVGTQYKDYLSKSFLDKFIGKGNFEILERKQIHPAFQNLDIDTANPEIHIFGAYPFVFLIDIKHLDGLPLPTRWQDLLNPAYQEKICLASLKYGPDLMILFYIYKNYGRQGLVQFRKNVKLCMHTSRMGRYIGTEQNERVAIYLITTFFAKTCHGKPNVKLIWPEEGAIFHPVFLLVKKGLQEKYRMIIDYLLGKDFGKLMADSHFPVTSPEVDNHLRPWEKLAWIGWDWLLKPDIDKIVVDIEDIFQDLPRNR